MPIPKGPNCFGDVMREHKQGKLSSGKGGPKVKSRKQAQAIASSMCHSEKEMGNIQAPLGYPAPRVGGINKSTRRSGGLKPGEDQMGLNQSGAFTEDFMKDKKGLGTHSGLGTGDGLAGTYTEKKKKGVAEARKHMGFSETAVRLMGVIDMMMTQREELVSKPEFNEEHEMLKSRLGVIDGRLGELIEMFEVASQEGGKVKMDGWMRDKLTMVADYLSAVTDHAVHGGGMEVEYEIEPGVMIVNQPEGPEMEYAEGEPEPSPKFAKKDHIKSHREQEVPHQNTDFAEQVKEAIFGEQPGENKMMFLQGLYGEKKADQDYDGDGKIESGTAEWKGARNNAIKKRKKAEKLGIDVPHMEGGCGTDHKEKGLWANIHAKKKRIKEGSGERMRKPGEKGAPSAKALKDSAKED